MTVQEFRVSAGAGSSVGPEHTSRPARGGSRDASTFTVGLTFAQMKVLAGITNARPTARRLLAHVCPDSHERALQERRD
jgi:hypothetical protein